MWRFVTESLNKMKGKIPEIASSHVSSRVLQVSFYILSSPTPLLTHPFIDMPCVQGLCCIVTSTFVDFVSPSRLVLSTVHKMKGILSFWSFGHISLA